MKPDYTMRWTDNSGTHYVSTINPLNLSAQKLDRKLYSIGTAEKECLRTSLINALGITLPEAEKIEVPVEKIVEVETVVEKEVPVEKIVEVEKVVEKEVPVEKIVEVYRTDPKEIELAVLKAKCEIYERLIFTDHFINKGVGND